MERERRLTEFSEVCSEPDECLRLDESFGDAQGNSEAVAGAGAAAELVNDCEAVLPDVPFDDRISLEAGEISDPNVPEDECRLSHLRSKR